MNARLLFLASASLFLPALPGFAQSGLYARGAPVSRHFTTSSAKIPVPPRPNAKRASYLNGTVQTDAGEALPGATVLVRSTYLAAPTNESGNFHLALPENQAYPFYVVVSFIGYESRSATITGPDQPLLISLSPSLTLVNEVVVSASRREESALRAPATVDKVAPPAIARFTPPDLITALAHQKGVDVTTSGMFMSALSTRGFGGATSERLVQLVDFMDTQSPSLNTNAGNSLGLPEVDIANVEILHGPSSALYGANAFNGVVLTSSRDPFMEPGLSVRLRGGNRDYTDAQLRFATKLSRRLAFKISGSFSRAQEWIATNEQAQDSRYVGAPNNAPGSPFGYDAVNRYGDIGNTFGASGGALAGKTVFMPGWSETALIANDNHAQLFRLIPSLHFLVTDKIKALVEFKHAQGTTAYQFTNRYRLKDFATNQYRAELKGENWFVRAYQTQDYGNNSYDLPLTGAFMQNSIDPASGLSQLTYAREYFGTYARAYNNQYSANGNNALDAAAFAQVKAAPFQLAAGSDAFNALRSKIISDDTPGRGSNLRPSSLLSDLSSQYEFRNDFANIIVGAAYRQYRLGSNGQLFADHDGQRIRNGEEGAYAQFSRILFDQRLSLTTAGRVDKSDNFNAVFSPRAAAVYTLDAERHQNLHLSYNQAYRSPTQQGQYLDLDLARVLLLGNITNGFSGYSTAMASHLGQILGSSNAPAALAPYQTRADRLRPERVATLEIGYKAQLSKRLSFDLSAYTSRYQDFIGQVRLISNVDGSQPTPAQLAASAGRPAPFQSSDQTTRIIQVQTNSTQPVKASGGLAAVNFTVSPLLSLTANYTFSLLSAQDLPVDFQSYYNTPRHKFNVGSYGALTKRLSYAAAYRWAEGFQFDSPFASGQLQDLSSLDGQLSLALPKLATTLQVGGSNLVNNTNVQIYGGPQIGRLLYAGLTLELK